MYPDDRVVISRIESNVNEPLRSSYGACNCGLSEEDHDEGGMGGSQVTGCLKFDLRWSALSEEDYGNDR